MGLWGFPHSCHPSSDNLSAPRPHIPTEFDFDDEPASPKSTLIDRRRAPGKPMGGPWQPGLAGAGVCRRP